MTQISFDIGKATDAGRTGKHNEDAYAVFSTRLQTEADSTKADIVQVAVVADGIGGSAAGERASQITVKTIQEVMTQTTVPIRQRLEAAIHESNTRIYGAAQNDPSLKGMGTTIVAAVIVDQLLFVAHAGDSRAYLIRVGVAHQLTKDHTWVQEALEAGYLSPEEATNHPNRNVLKR
jgi:protein phosphatase